MVGGGLILTVFAAKFLVSGAVTLATSLGVPETMIGLTIVAVGTSMPELVTSIVAARRGQSDLAFGNIIGSNIFNILGILGATAMVQPLTVPAAILGFDVWLMLAVTLVLCVFCRLRLANKSAGRFSNDSRLSRLHPVPRIIFVMAGHRFGDCLGSKPLIE